MQKFLSKTFAILLAIIIFSSQVFATPNSSFTIEDETLVNFDESEIYNSFSEINDLTVLLSENENISYSDLENENKSLIENVSQDAALALNSQEESSPLIVGAFWYGCMFSAIGILLVAFVTDNNPEQIKSAVWGCIVSTIGVPVLSSLFMIILTAAGILSFSVGY